MPPQLLLKNAERVMIDLVNLTGLKINSVMKKTHLKNALQFVSGLGPRTSALPHL